jgi:CheY-like chemotaxis protein
MAQALMTKKSFLDTISQYSFLVVDDMPTMRKMIRSMLMQTGVKGLISEANDGKEALDKLQNKLYDFIICDINMPRMDGLEFLKVIRETEEFKDIPILMITGEVSEDIVASAAESEVDNYLLKPFQVGALESRIMEIVQKKQTPSPGETIFRQAEAYRDAKEYERAIQEALKLCQPSYVKQAKVLNLLGECYLQLGDHKTAEKFLSAALEHNPRYIKTYKNYSTLKEQTGEMEEAIKAVEAAVQLSPRNSTRLLDMGRLLIKTGEKEAGQEFLQKAIKIAPSSAQELQIEAAEIMLQNGMAAEAEAMFMKSINNDPKNVHLYNRLGVALRQQKKHQEAMELYKKALKIDPENDITYYNLAILFFDLGEKDKSQESVIKAIKIRPDFKEAREFYNYFFSKKPTN